MKFEYKTTSHPTPYGSGETHELQPPYGDIGRGWRLREMHVVTMSVNHSTMPIVGSGSTVTTESPAQCLLAVWERVVDDGSVPF